MKKSFRILAILLSLFLFACLFAACGNDDTDDGTTESGGDQTTTTTSRKEPAEEKPFELKYTQTIDKTAYSVSGYAGSLKGKDPVIIPASYEGLPVTEIGDFAFANCTSLVDISIPASIKKIGASAFDGCSRIENISLPNSLISMGDSVFRGCDKLKYNVHEHVRYLGNAENPYLVLVSLEQATATHTVHTNTKVIAERAFYGQTSLESVVIPASVRAIGSYAFAECTSLRSVSLQAAIDEIKESTFDGCTVLAEITIPNTVKSIGASAFRGCGQLTEMVVPSEVTSIGSYAFYHCDKLASISVPDSLSKIGFGAFYSCPTLAYTAYDNAYYIGNTTNPYLILVKAKDSQITACNISAQTRLIADNAFAHCETLTSITIPDSVISIGSFAFSACVRLETVTLSAGITMLGDHAFFDCEKLAEIVIPTSVEEIGSYAFFGCTSLETITFERVEGWHLVFDAKEAYVRSIEVVNDTENAKYLTKQFYDPVWKCR